jgi:hypothetical protein
MKNRESSVSIPHAKEARKTRKLNLNLNLNPESQEIKRSPKDVPISPTGGNPDFSSGRKDGGNMD